MTNPTWGVQIGIGPVGMKCPWALKVILDPSFPFPRWATALRNSEDFPRHSIWTQVMERSSSMSADLYSDLIIGLGMKIYPKMTPHIPQSTYRFQRYGKVFFHVSWFVQWPHHWIRHEKLPNIDPSYALFHALVSKLHKGLLPCQLICTVTSPLDWAWKTTPKWPLICHILPIGSKVMERSSSMSADLYCDITFWFGMKNYP